MNRIILGCLVLLAACAPTPVVPTSIEPNTVSVQTEATITFGCHVEKVLDMDMLLTWDHHPNGLTFFLFDTNADGVKDVSLNVPTQDIDNRYALFHMIDRDYDDVPDVMYVDQRRDGTCQGIEEYDGFRKPQAHTEQAKGL